MPEMRAMTSGFRLDEERLLAASIEKRISAEAVESFLSILDRTSCEDLISEYFTGQCRVLSAEVGARYFRVCKAVQRQFNLQNLHIRYFVSGEEPDDIDASSFYNIHYSRKQPHAIVFKKGLLDTFSEEELKFVAGHEIGHIVFSHARLRRIIELIFPTMTEMPCGLRNIYSRWKRLGELSADRMGLFAAGSLRPAIIALLKVQSADGCSNFDGSCDDIDCLDGLFAAASGGASDILSSYPSGPVRMTALRYFYESGTWQRLVAGEAVAQEQSLQKKIRGLISTLEKKPANEKDHQETIFLMSAGYLLISCDGKVKKSEVDALINLLSENFYMNPEKFHRLTLNKAALRSVMARSAMFFAKQYPQRTRHLYKKLLVLIMKDRKIHTRERNLALRIAGYLDIPRSEAARLSLRAIQEWFLPMG